MTNLCMKITDSFYNENEIKSHHARPPFKENATFDVRLTQTVEETMVSPVKWFEMLLHCNVHGWLGEVKESGSKNHFV